MMSRKLLLLASVGLVSLQMASAQSCSSVCNACCPPGKGSVSLDGDCVDDTTKKPLCYLETGRCRSGTAAVPCDAVPTPTLKMTHGGSVDPNSGIAVPNVVTFLAEGTPVWDELALTALPGKKAQLVNVPQAMLDATPWAWFTPKATQIPTGTTVTMECVVGSACSVAVFLYECNPCESEKGNLPAMLLGDGFQRTRCAPSFTNGRTDTLHRMTAYTKNLGVGERYEFVAPGPIDFMSIGLSFRPLQDCSTLDEPTCRNTDLCAWKGRCELNTCVQQGPGGGCNTQTCVKKELA